ncbi:MAG: aminopeptidase P family protein [Gemmatimonadales bacterium]|nr:MAG: aminopeptidase P family protein [Gemmatimonadales bacterium]
MSVERRIRGLREQIAGSRLTGLLVTHLPNIRYISGFTGSSGVLLVEPDLASLFTDFRYETQAAEELGPPVTARIVRGGTWAALSEWLKESPPGRRMGFEAARLSVADRDQLTAACSSVVWEPTEDIIERRRAMKDPAEIASIEEAVDLADLVLEMMHPEIKVGVTETELAARLEYQLRRAGSGPLPFESIVAFGERTALPHAAPTGRPLAAGELVLLDFGASVDGYCSDMTRVFTAGRAADWQRDLHREVMAACEAGIRAIRPGALCSAVDSATRDQLATAGLAERFGHSTGHGVGLEIHEAPRLHRDAEDSLNVGNVVTVEPGVYLPGRGGIRIEQIVAVQPDGSRILTRSSPELIEL